MSDTATTLFLAAAPDAQREAADQEATEAADVLAQMRAWPVETPEDEQDAADLLGAVKVKIKDLEEKRKSVTGPLLQAKKAVDDLFRPARTAYEEAERILKDKLAERQLAREESNRAALAAATAAAQAGAPQDAQAALATVQEQSSPQGTATRWEWCGMIEDQFKVPREFLEVSPSKVRQYCAKYKDSTTIPAVPGLTFVRRPNIIARGQK